MKSLYLRANKSIEIYLCVTLYHLFISLLIINNKKAKENSVLLLFANDKNVYILFEKMIPLLNECGYYAQLRLRNKKRSILGLEEKSIEDEYIKVERHFKKEIQNDFVLFNYAWNFQYIYSTAELFYRKAKEVVLVEEGVLAAYTKPQPFYKVKIKKLFGAIENFEKQEKIVAIFAQRPDTYPEKLQRKLVEFHVRDLCDELTNDQSDELLKILLGENADLISKMEDEELGIIYTQPFSEDGIVTEEQKISDLKKIVNYYEKYGKPIIKLHPRDKSDYMLDSKYMILPGSFPSEVFLLKRMGFKYAVGINTSAVFTTNAKYQIVLNENYDAEKRFELKPINEQMVAE